LQTDFSNRRIVVDLLTFIIVVAVVGVIMWLVNTYIPMAPGIKGFLNIGVIVILVLWLLFALLGGNLGSLHTIRIGR
jgi:hypothetical protein